MKVLHFVCSPGHRGGAENAAKYLSEELKTLQVDTKYLSMSDESKHIRLTAPQIVPQKYRNFFTSFEPLDLNLKSFDIIHIHNVHPAIAVKKIALEAKKAGVPTVFTTHGIFEITSILDRFDSNPATKLAYEIFIKKPLIQALTSIDRFAFLTENDKKLVEDLIGTEIKKSEIIYNGVNPELLKEHATEPDVKSKFGITDPYALYVGNLKYNKGIEFLIEAGKNLPGQIVVVGKAQDEKYLEHLHALAKQSEANVIFTGFTEWDELKALYNQCSVFCLPTIADTLPLVILDAMAFKKPVVSSNISGIPEEVLDGKTGYLVPPKDINALSEKLTILLEDKNKASEFGHAGFEHLTTNFTWKMVAQKTLNLYNQILDK